MKNALRLSVLALSLAAGLALSGQSFGEDKAPPKVEKPKVAAKLGGELDKLDLTDAQKADILKIRADLKPEVAKLQEQIKKLNEDAKAKEMAVLSPEQKAKLQEAEDAHKKASEEKAKAEREAKAKAAETKPAPTK